MTTPSWKIGNTAKTLNMIYLSCVQLSNQKWDSIEKIIVPDIEGTGEPKVNQCCPCFMRPPGNSNPLGTIFLLQGGGGNVCYSRIQLILTYPSK